MLVPAFLNHLSTDKSQAVAAINHSNLSTLWINGRVELFVDVVCVLAAKADVSWHCEIKNMF